MSKSVLIIGGSGLLGTALRVALAHDQNFTVSSPTSAELDILDVSHLQKISKYNIVCNLTGQVTNPFSLCEELNSVGVKNLVAALKESSAVLVQISTTLVYGTTKNAKEDSPLHPENAYAECKAGAEHVIQVSLPEDRYLIARFSNMYGAGQNKGLLWYLINTIRQNKDIQITDNDGSLLRYFLHVEDAASILRDLMQADARGVFNVAGTESHSIRDLLTLCEKVLGRPIAATYADTPPVGNIDAISTEKLQKAISPKYLHSLEQYLSENLIG